MTEDMMALRGLMEKSADAELGAARGFLALVGLNRSA